jgi:flagellar hook-length control protein FliK
VPAEEPQGAQNAKVDLAMLQKKSGSHQMDLWLRDNELGRVSLRMVERAGLVSAVVRADNQRGAELLSGSLPQLLESLSERGLQPVWSGASHFDDQREQQERQNRSRQQGMLRQAGRRRGNPAAVFQVAEVMGR